MKWNKNCPFSRKFVDIEISPVHRFCFEMLYLLLMNAQVMEKVSNVNKISFFKFPWIIQEIDLKSSCCFLDWFLISYSFVCLCACVPWKVLSILLIITLHILAPIVFSETRIMFVPGEKRPHEISTLNDKDVIF